MSSIIPSINDIKSILIGEISESSCYRLTINTVLHKYYSGAMKHGKRMYYTMETFDDQDARSSGLDYYEYQDYVDEIVTEDFLNNDHIRIDFHKLVKYLAITLPGMKNPRVYIKMHHLGDEVKVMKLPITKLKVDEPSNASKIDPPAVKTPKSASAGSWADRTEDHDKKMKAEKESQMQSSRTKVIDQPSPQINAYEKLRCYRLLMLTMSQEELEKLNQKFIVLEIPEELSKPTFDPNKGSIVLQIYELMNLDEIQYSKLKQIVYLVSSGKMEIWRPNVIKR
jgi:hypothetical protein